MSEQAYVPIMARGRNGTICIGSTVDLGRRAWEHRNGVIAGFTKSYGCRHLVWDWESARLRERQMKEWKLAWKLREIEGLNPEWEDLYYRVANQ